MRALKLAKYLPRHGWDVAVLTSDGRHAGLVDRALLADVPPSVRVVRARSWEVTAPRLERALAERAGLALALEPLLRLKRTLQFPDERVGWLPRALQEGLALLRSFRPHAVLSTSPAASAHVVARLLSARGGIPWVADFRESWMQNPFLGRRQGAAAARMERWWMRGAAAAVGVTPAIVEEFRERYAERLPPQGIHWIPNGFDLEDRVHVDAGAAERIPTGGFVLAAAGVGRHPRILGPLLDAMAALRREGMVVRLRLAGTGFPGAARESRERGVADLVEVLSAIPYHEVLRLLGASDATLLVLGPGADSRLSLSTALFDAFLARRFILVLAGSGYAAELAVASGLGRVANPSDAEAIAAALRAMISARAAPAPDQPNQEAIGPFNRAEHARRFAELLERSL